MDDVFYWFALWGGKCSLRRAVFLTGSLEMCAFSLHADIGWECVGLLLVLRSWAARVFPIICEAVVQVVSLGLALLIQVVMYQLQEGMQEGISSALLCVVPSLSLMYQLWHMSTNRADPQASVQR